MCKWWCKLLQSTGRPKVHRIFIVCLWRTNCKCIKKKKSKERQVSTCKSRICLRKKQFFLWWLLKPLQSEWCWEIILCFLVADSQIWLELLCSTCSLRCFQVVLNCEIAASMFWRQYIAHGFSTHFQTWSSIVHYSGNLNVRKTGRPVFVSFSPCGIFSCWGFREPCFSHIICEDNNKLSSELIVPFQLFK